MDRPAWHVRRSGLAKVKAFVLESPPYPSDALLQPSPFTPVGDTRPQVVDALRRGSAVGP